MIPLQKLSKLAPRHRMRKIALVLGEVERLLLAQKGLEFDPSMAAYSLGLCGLLVDEKEAAGTVAEAARRLAAVASACAGEGEGLLRAVDALRHSLLAATGQAPADWDLIDPSTGLLDPGSRRAIPGLKAYLEDLRSPFNVGSIFRTADAFGADELILSPLCADPLHPRALRSAMGAVELLPWRRATLEELADGTAIFALELGGTPLESFVFPKRGIVVIGSEELGISRQNRSLCDFGTVSIPMSGAKASLNVAVAFGILMYEWARFSGASQYLL